MRSSHNKEIKLFFLSVFVIVVLPIFIIGLMNLTKLHPVLGFVPFVLFLTSSGLCLSELFREQLPYNDILGYIINSLIWGSIFTPFALLILGFIGFKYTNENMLLFIVILVFLNIFFALILRRKEKKIPFIKFLKSNNNWIDLVFVLLTSLSFFFIIQICLENYTQMWDSFTFWGVDSKYLFDNRQLRTIEFDLLSSNRYTSYYPLITFLSYFFMGGIFEQFSSLITILFAFLAFLMVFNLARNQSSIRGKLLSYTSFILVLSSFLSIQTVLVSQYADVFASFLLLLFVVVLLNGKQNKELYHKRLFVLLFLCLTFYLVKPAYITTSFLCLSIYILHDFTFLKDSYRTIISNLKVWSTILFFLITTFLIYQYFIPARQIESSPSLIELKSYPLMQYFSYVLHLGEYLLSNLPLPTLLVGSLFLVWVLNSNWSKKELFGCLTFLSVTLLPIGYYILNFSQDFASMSLLRYVSIGFFAIPFLFYFIVRKKDFNKGDNRVNIILLVLTIGVNIFFVARIYSNYNLDLRLNPNDGKYSTAVGKYYLIAEKAYTLVGNESKILLMDVANGTENRITNKDIPGIFTRYFLAEKSVGIMYDTDISGLKNIITTFTPDYLLILEYDGYLSLCDEDLQIGRSYLLRIDENLDFEVESTECPVGEIEDSILLD